VQPGVVADVPDPEDDRAPGEPLQPAATDQDAHRPDDHQRRRLAAGLDGDEIAELARGAEREDVTNV